MTGFSVRYAQAAADDVLAACLWLEGVQPGLGDRLLNELDRLAGLLAANPSMFERSSAGCRRAVLRTFDYALVYRVLPDAVQVLGLLHCRLDPMVAASRSEAAG